MPEHYSKNTVQVSVWCKVCAKFTPHRIDGGRRGPCLVCMDKLDSAPPAKLTKAELGQGKLF